MTTEKMTPLERRSVLSLAAIMSLRLLGLFMILPVFSLYAHQLLRSTPLLIGIALGIYGLTQGLFQIPFGMLSDRLGRKPIITFGLMIFALGSLVAGFSHTITGMIIGRALQGAGAIGSTVIAMIADLTRENQRTKAMAINGISIGLSFSLAMMLGPVLAAWIHVSGIFWISTGLSFIALLLLFSIVPNPVHSEWHSDAELDTTQFTKILLNKTLARFNLSVFILHAIFTATFIALPMSLHNINGFDSAQQWKLFLPALIFAFLFSMPCIMRAEKKRQVRTYFWSGIILLLLAEIIWRYWMHITLVASLGLLLFFMAFTMLEAFLPSLVSRAAPATRKGTAMGIFSCAQFLGIFFGGTVGGWIYGAFNLSGIYLFCIALAITWLLLAFSIQNPQYSTHASQPPSTNDI